MKKNRLFALLLISLTLIGVSSVGISLAWFASGIYAQVDNINIAIRSEAKILISTSKDLSTFKDELTKDDDLKKVDSFSPVSSMYTNRWLNQGSEDEKLFPKFVDSYAHVDESETVFYTKQGFYSQELYLYSEDDLGVSFKPDSVQFTPNEELNEKTYEKVKDLYPEMTKEQIMTNLNNITKSLRVSLYYKTNDTYNYVIVDPYKNEETYFAGILDADVNGYFDTDDSNYEIVYGDYNDESKIVYDAELDHDITHTKPTTCFNSSHKAHTMPFNLNDSINNGFVPAIENSIKPSEAEDSFMIELRNEEPTRVVLSIYLEGWDTLNTNLMKEASFFANIQFTIKGDI